MPTYDYACGQCGYRFEEFQSMTADPLTECPRCHEQSLQRLIGAGAGLLFKGSGFYLTDYKKSKTSTASTSASSDTPANGTSAGDSASTSTPASGGKDTASGGSSSSTE